MGSPYSKGEQPCLNYQPATDAFGMANVHECFCPFDGSNPCDMNVSWCENCNKDHHQNGYDKCKGCGVEEDVQDE